MGLGAYRTAWKRQTKYFGHTHLAQYSSLVWDNRGVGLSDKPLSRYSTTEMAKDVVDLLTHLAWIDSTISPVRVLNVVGVSMGGMIAQELGLLIPEWLNSLSLISTFPRLVRSVPFIQNLRDRINMFVPQDVDVQLEDVAHRLFSDEFLSLPDTENADPSLNFPTNRDRFAAAELSKRSDKQGFTKKGFMLQAVAAGWHNKSAEQLKELGDRVGRERILVTHGTLDRMITFSHAEILKRELQPAVFKVFEGKGHVLMWEEEREFNAMIEEFVQKCGKAGK